MCACCSYVSHRLAAAAAAAAVAAAVAAAAVAVAVAAAAAAAGVGRVTHVPGPVTRVLVPLVIVLGYYGTCSSTHYSHGVHSYTYSHNQVGDGI